ncbi:MAG: hypothetical protein M3Z32_13430 [Acidobacteriota bacterium]|nr:hypothetical protein [Acidobacteriota bacterium]
MNFLPVYRWSDLPWLYAAWSHAASFHAAWFTAALIGPTSVSGLNVFDPACFV